MTFNTWSSCEETNQKYYVHEGRLADFSFLYQCECCDTVDENDLAYVIGNTPPVVGDEIAYLIGNSYKGNFIHANTLLSILRSKEYADYEYDEFLAPNND